MGACRDDRRSRSRGSGARRAVLGGCRRIGVRLLGIVLCSGGGLRRPVSPPSATPARRRAAGHHRSLRDAGPVHRAACGRGVRFHVGDGARASSVGRAGPARRQALSACGRPVRTRDALAGDRARPAGDGAYLRCLPAALGTVLLDAPGRRERAPALAAGDDRTVRGDRAWPTRPAFGARGSDIRGLTGGFDSRMVTVLAASAGAPFETLTVAESRSTRALPPRSPRRARAVARRSQSLSQLRQPDVGATVIGFTVGSSKVCIPMSRSSRPSAEDRPAVSACATLGRSCPTTRGLDARPCKNCGGRARRLPCLGRRLRRPTVGRSETFAAVECSITDACGRLSYTISKGSTSFWAAESGSLIRWVLLGRIATVELALRGTGAGSPSGKDES